MSTKIKPAIRGPKNYVNFSELDSGDAFIWHGGLFMKADDTDRNDQSALCLNDGEWTFDMCGESVLPIDVVITWTKIKE